MHERLGQFQHLRNLVQPLAARLSCSGFPLLDSLGGNANKLRQLRLVEVELFASLANYFRNVHLLIIQAMLVVRLQEYLDEYKQVL